MRKAIYFVLDTLLILGALTAVLTIDGGKWITSRQVAVLSSEAGYNSKTATAVQVARGTSSSEYIYPKASDCSTLLMPSMPDWYVAYPLLNAINSGNDLQGQQVSRAPGC